jgi:hypothetical protein
MRTVRNNKIERERLLPTGEEDASGPRAASADMSWVDDPFLEQPVFPDERFLNNESKRARAICVAGSIDYDRVGASLKELVAAATPIPVYFVIIPDEFQVNDRLWEQVLASSWLKNVELERDLPQEQLGAWFMEQDIEYLDLLPRLRASSPLTDGELHLYHRNDTHFNSRGNRVAGEALAEFLTARLK